MENVEREREREKLEYCRVRIEEKKKDGQFSKLGQQSLSNQP